MSVCVSWLPVVFLDEFFYPGTDASHRHSPQLYNEPWYLVIHILVLFQITLLFLTFDLSIHYRLRFSGLKKMGFFITIESMHLLRILKLLIHESDLSLFIHDFFHGLYLLLLYEGFGIICDILKEELVLEDTMYVAFLNSHILSNLSNC